MAKLKFNQILQSQNERFQIAALGDENVILFGITDVNFLRLREGRHTKLPKGKLEKLLKKNNQFTEAV